MSSKPLYNAIPPSLRLGSHILAVLRRHGVLNSSANFDTMNDVLREAWTPVDEYLTPIVRQFDRMDKAIDDLSTERDKLLSEVADLRQRLMNNPPE
jgi:hypothetical protein